MGSKQRYYWLSSDKASSQDTFFLEALDQTLWSPGTADNWDTCWRVDMPDADVFEQVSGTKTLNHIPGNNALTIKSELAITLNNARNQVQGLPQASRYDFFPETYSMPGDYFKFQAEAAKNPKTMWIQKPKNLSRGRGIEMVQNPASVPIGSDWMIQEYLAKPHLYDDHKYVLRCYVLVTSVEPLRCYFYQEGFAKLASATYSDEDLDNPYRHLTNPDINEDNTEVEKPVTFLSFAEYRQWLKSNGHDDDKLFASLKDLITLTVIAARENMRDQAQNIEASTEGCYELIGLDCMVDDELKPWILECNLSPSLDTYANEGAGGDNEVKIKRQLLVDLISTLGLNNSDEERQQFLNLSPAQKAAVERARAGNFECLFPTEHANNYLHCFPVPRYVDIASVPEGSDIDLSNINTSINQYSEHLFDDSLAIFSHTNQQLMLPNEIASWVWLQNAEGRSVEEMVQELQQVTSCPENISAAEFESGLYQQVWDVLADWAKSHIFQTVNSTVTKDRTLTNTSWSNTRHITIGGVNVELSIACEIADNYLGKFLDYYASEQNKNALLINVVRSKYGYTLLNQSRIIDSYCKLAEIASALLSAVMPNTLQQNNIALVSASVVKLGEKHVLLATKEADISDAISYQWSLESSVTIISGAIKLNNNGTSIDTTNYPLYLPTKGSFAIKTTPDEPSQLITEYRDVGYTLTTIKNSGSKTIDIDAVILLETGTASINAMTQAETITQLWPCCPAHSQANANNLAQWVKQTQGMKLQCNNPAEAIALLATLNLS